MAAQYRPVSVSLNGLPPEVFGAPKDFTFMDAMKEEESLQSQQQSNDLNAISVQQKQRANAQDMQLIEALQQKYAGQDPSSFNPDDALQIAQRVALQNGDLNTALSVERATRERAGNQPYSDSERTLLAQEFGMDLPEGLSKNFMSDLINLRGKNLYADSLSDTRENRGYERATLLPEGYEGNPSRDDSKKFKTTLGATSRVNAILDQLEESVGRTGNDQMTGQDAVIQRQLVGDLALELKSPAFGNLGAALSPSEYQLLLTQLPLLMQSPNTSFAQIAIETGLGRDPIDAIRQIRNKIQRNLDIESSVRNVRRVPSQTGGGTETPTSNAPSLSGGLPRNADGSPLTREQFLAQRGK